MSNPNDSEKTERTADRRETVKKVISLLPSSVQPYLAELDRSSESDPRREPELFSALRSTLNTLTVEGALPRRTFLQIAGLVVTGGLAPFLYPEKAHAWQQWTGFWQNINNNSYTVTNSGTDPYWDYVVLLMNMDGSNGSTVFVDDSNVGKTPTIGGAPYIDTSSSPFSGGKGSAKFGGSSDYFSVPASSDFNFGTGDFTVECWVKLAATSDQSIWSQMTSTNDTAINFAISSASAFRFATAAGGSDFTVSTSFSTGQWYHLAVTKSGGTLRGFVNGSVAASRSDSNSWGSSSYSNYIGKEAGRNNASALNGAISDLRVYKGVAKYTAAFTPTTAPIGISSFNDPYWGYCVLACPFENTLKDMSGSSCASNGPSLSSSVKKYGTASAAFNGSGQYLTCPNSSSWQLTGDFTIECFVYVNNVSGNQAIVQHKGNYGDYGWEMTFSSGVPTFYLSANGTSSSGIVGPAAISINTWYHLAVTRSNGTVRLFQDGVLIGSMSNSNSSYASSTPLNIGRNVETNVWHLNGYIDSLRITKGYARYTQNFTPPTAAFPVGRDESSDPFWTNTVLAMHMDDLTDATGRHTITNSSSTINTSTYKFGSGSVYFSGSTYFSISAGSDFNFGTDSFTVEYWIYSTESDSSFHRHVDQQSGGGWFLRTNQGGWNSAIAGSLYVGDKGNSYANVAMPKNAWVHVAFSKNGTNYQMFMNGVQVFSGSDSTSWGSSSNVLYVGGSTERMVGYLDDLRITKGVARYTQNFTPPTRAFANGTNVATGGYDLFWSNVILALSGSGTNGSTPTTDLTGKTLSLTGSMPISNSQSKWYGTSLYGDQTAAPSTNNYLQTARSSGFALTGDFTMRCWARVTDVNSYFTFLGHEDYSGSQNGNWMWKWNNTASFTFATADSGQTNWENLTLSGISGVSNGAWNHFEVARKGSTMYGFVNGTLIGTATVSKQLSQTATNAIRIGANTSGVATSAYMNDVQIYAGVALHTNSFPAPIAPMSTSAPSTYPPAGAAYVTSGLVAVLDAGEGACINGSDGIVRNLVSSPAESSSRAAYDFKFGDGSTTSTFPTFVGVPGGKSANDYFSFDGGDYLSISGGNTTFINSIHKSGGTCTIEALIYYAGTSNRVHIAVTENYGTNGDGIWFNITSADKVTFGAWNASLNQLIVSNTTDNTLSKNRWHHIALSLLANGSSFFYVNGDYSPAGGSNTWTATYANSNTANASRGLGIFGIQASSNVYADAGNRLAIWRLYNRALSKAELDQNWSANRSRFGL